MTQSDLHDLWHSKHKAAKLRISHSIVGDFISCYNDKIGPTGIRTEYAKIEDILNGGDLKSLSEKSEIRYGETAYTIWALGHRLGRWDILEANIGNWGDGEDEGGSSRFRNIEFECQVALRLLEEDHKVEPLEGSHEAEMVVDNFFAIECKRQYDISGLLRNTIKARDQIKTSGYPGVLIVNIDDLEGLNIDPCNEETIGSELIRVGRVAEYGFGKTKSELAGVVIEYVNDTLSVAREGSYVHTVHNCPDRTTGRCSNILDKTLDGLIGSEERDIHDPQVPLSDRFTGEYSKEDEQDYFDFYDDHIEK